MGDKELEEVVDENVEKIINDVTTKKKQYDTRTGMIIVLFVAILIAVVPQVIYEAYLMYNGDYELTWQLRDRFLLFSFTSHLTIILITISGIVIYIRSAKMFDAVVELVKQSAEGTRSLINQLIKQVKQMILDVESMKPATDRATEIYHANKPEIDKAFVMFEDMMKVMPAFQEVYGERLKKLARMDKELQKEALKEFVDNAFKAHQKKL